MKKRKSIIIEEDFVKKYSSEGEIKYNRY